MSPFPTMFSNLKHTFTVTGPYLRYSDPEDQFLDHFIFVISVVLREPTVTISDWTVEPVAMKSEILRVVSHVTTEISEIKRLKFRSSASDYLNPFPNKPWYLPVCSTNLLKTLWEKEKLLTASNFSFSLCVFYLS